MRFLSVDIETTGLDPRVHGITEFAAVATDLTGKIGMAVFYAWVYPEGMVWTHYCLELHHEWLAKVRERVKAKAWRGTGVDNPPIATTYRELYNAYRDWAFTMGFYHQESSHQRKPTAAGKNFGAFDVQFLNHRFEEHAFKHRSLDPAHYYVQEGDTEMPDLKTCKARAIAAGCSTIQSSNVMHNALSDAIDVALLIHFAYSKGWIIHE